MSEEKPKNSIPVEVQERRYRRFLMPETLMISILSFCKYEKLCRFDQKPGTKDVMFTALEFPDLPEDAWIRGVHYIPEYQAFGIIVASMKYEPIPANVVIPTFPEPTTKNFQFRLKDVRLI